MSFHNVTKNRFWQFIRLSKDAPRHSVAKTYEIDYAARITLPDKPEEILTSEDVMKDPVGKFVDLDKDVIIPPFLENVITDTHFSERNRQGRLMGFMAKAIYNSGDLLGFSKIKAIASDEATAFCYKENGIGRVYGSGSVFFLKGNASIERVEKNKSLHWFQNHKAVKVYELKDLGKLSSLFYLKNWSSPNAIEQYWWVNGADATAPYFGID